MPGIYMLFAFLPAEKNLLLVVQKMGKVNKPAVKVCDSAANALNALKDLQKLADMLMQLVIADYFLGKRKPVALLLCKRVAQQLWFCVVS
jgi:hypothetical protein